MFINTFKSILIRWLFTVRVSDSVWSRRASFTALFIRVKVNVHVPAAARDARKSDLLKQYFFNTHHLVYVRLRAHFDKYPTFNNEIRLIFTTWRATITSTACEEAKLNQQHAEFITKRFLKFYLWQARKSLLGLLLKNYKGEANETEMRRETCAANGRRLTNKALAFVAFTAEACTRNYYLRRECLRCFVNAQIKSD